MEKLGVGFSKKEIQLHKGIAGLKYYLIVMYLRLHLMPINILPTTLSKLITRCGYSASTRRSTTYDDWRNIIHKLIDDGYMKCSQDIMKVKPTEEFILTFSNKKNPFYTNDSFVFITKKEFDVITNYKTNMNKSVIMGVNIRNFNAKDLNNNKIIDGEEISGNFINAIERLDELKNDGVAKALQHFGLVSDII